VRGTATKARSKVWNIFGKTGTAHVSGGREGYNDTKYTSSFMAGAPYENPRIVVVLVIHEPDKSAAAARGVKHYGGAVAAPGAARVVERTLAYLAVPPGKDLPLPPAGVAGVLYNYNEKLYKIGTVTASVRE
jgi:cell division protein FtsI (penicillin-binding protein 3)